MRVHYVLEALLNADIEQDETGMPVRHSAS